MELIGPIHPCYLGEGEWDHNWKTQDDSYSHEYGTEIVVYDLCLDCELTREHEPPDWDDYG